MPADDHLTVRERATLLALMAQAREVTNAELEAAAGLRLDGAARRRLNDRKLVGSTKVGRSFTHELTDDGWAWCRAELSATRPERAGYGGGALYALLGSFERYLTRSGLQLADVFAPDVEAQVRVAYARLAKPGEWVGLVSLREELHGVPRTEVDTALERLTAAPGVHLQGEPNRQALSDAHRAAALRVAGDDRHMLMIEAG